MYGAAADAWTCQLAAATGASTATPATHAHRDSAASGSPAAAEEDVARPVDPRRREGEQEGVQRHRGND